MSDDEYICKSCGSIGAETHKRGSGWITLILLFCYIVPGIIYSLWRSTTVRLVCSECGSPEIVGTDTPIGQKLVTQYHSDD